MINATIHQAVVLAGGRGKRLGSLTQSTPKPLLHVADRAFMEYLICNLKRNGITNILLSVGYLGEQIIGHFGDGSRYGVFIDYIIESKPAGTGGALLLAREKLYPSFLVMNGDTLFDISYLDLALLCQHSDAVAVMALRKISDAKRYGAVELTGNIITGFSEKCSSGPGIVNGGIYFMEKRCLDDLPSTHCSLERDLFPILAVRGVLAGKLYEGFFIDIGTPETFKKADRLVSAWKSSCQDFQL